MHTQDDIERIARKRAGAEMGFIVHATIYVLVNLMLMAASFSMDRGWAVFPLLGWGFGLAMHGLAVFVLGGGSALRERLVLRERERLQREQNRQP